MKPDNEWNDYEIRTGEDGKTGIYLRNYNVRLATFNANTFALQKRLAKLFNAGIASPDIRRARQTSAKSREHA